MTEDIQPQCWLGAQVTQLNEYNSILTAVMIDEQGIFRMAVRRLREGWDKEELIFSTNHRTAQQHLAIPFDTSTHADRLIQQMVDDAALNSREERTFRIHLRLLKDAYEQKLKTDLKLAEWTEEFNQTD